MSLNSRNTNKSRNIKESRRNESNFCHKLYVNLTYEHQNMENFDGRNCQKLRGKVKFNLRKNFRLIFPS